MATIIIPTIIEIIVVLLFVVPFILGISSFAVINNNIPNVIDNSIPKTIVFIAVIFKKYIISPPINVVEEIISTERIDL